MTRALLFRLALLLLASPAMADMYQDGSNAKFPGAREHLGTGACDPVAEFGADPTGDQDATAAINACAALRGHQMNIRLPVGDFKVLSQVNLQSGQVLSGSGRTTTRLIIYDGFSPTAEAVIKLNHGGIDLGSEVRDLAVWFIQPDSQGSRAGFQPLGTCTMGGTGCKYPPAIKIDGARAKVSNIHINKAWKGIVSTSAGWFNNIEIGALDTGLDVAPAGTQILDWSHYNGIHIWPFGFFTGTPLYDVMTDGQTIGARFGDANGVNINDMVSLHGRIIVDGALFWGDWTNVNLDSIGARLEVVRNAQPGLRITNMYATYKAGYGNCKVDIQQNAGFVQITNAFFQTGAGGTSGESAVCVAGSHFQLSNSIFITDGDQRAVLMTSAGAPWLELSGNKFLVENGTVPVVDVQGGAIRAVNNHFPFYSTNVGSIKITADSPNHYLSDNSTDVWPVVFGFSLGGSILGYYDLGNQGFSASTVNASFDVPGTSVLTTDAWGGQFYLRGNYVEGNLDVIWHSNAYTGASGPLFINIPNLPRVKNNGDPVCTVAVMSYILMTTLPSCNTHAKGFTFSKVNNAAAMSAVSTAEAPPNWGGMAFRVGWRYRIR